MKQFFRNYYPQIFKLIIMLLVMIVICSWMLYFITEFTAPWVLQSAIISSIFLIAITLIYNHLEK